MSKLPFRMDHFFGATLLIVAQILLLTAGTHAQSAGSATAGIAGIVKTESGSPLGGITILVKNVEIGVQRMAQSKADGTFRLPGLVPGSYEVAVTGKGFAAQNEKVDLVVGVVQKMDFTLSPEALTATVEVRGKAPQGETTPANDFAKTAGFSNYLQRQINGLPINRRNFLDYSVLSPRVTADPLGRSGAFPTSGLSFNGQGTRNNNLTIDGLDNNDLGVGQVRATFSQEGVREFQVLSDNTSAEFGRALGGIINIVTKSGTDDLHGSLFYLFRNDALAARNAFSDTKPPYSQHQFGGTFGGPLRKGRLFSFTSFERLTVQDASVVAIPGTVLEPARKQGFLAENGAQPFSTTTTNVLGRVDWVASPNDLLFARYNYGGGFNGAAQAFGGSTSRDTTAEERRSDNAIAVSNIYNAPNSALVNETRFLFNRRKFAYQAVDLQGPQLAIFGGELPSAVNIGRDPFTPSVRNSNIFQVTNNLTLVLGRHTLKLGGDYLHDSQETVQSLLPAGFAQFAGIDLSSLPIPGDGRFSPLQAFDPSRRSLGQRVFLSLFAQAVPSFIPGFPTGVRFADLPLPTIFGQGFANQSPASYPRNLFSAFFQDDFRVRENLLIKAGLRYDYSHVRSIPGDKGLISPRLAVAYRPGGLKGLSVSASYGLYMSPILSLPAGFVAGRSSQDSLLVLTFPFSVLAYNQPGHRFPESTTFPAGVPRIRQLGQEFQIDQNIKTSYAQQSRVGVEYEFSSKTSIRAEYIYLRGLRLFGFRNINPVVRPVPGDLLGSLTTGRLDPTRGDIFEFETGFDSYYHAGTIQLRKRLSNNFSGNIHYTYSKSLGTVVDTRPGTLGDYQNGFDLRGERGFSAQDLRHRFVMSATWDINYARHPLLRDYQLSAILTVNSGLPYNLQAGIDLNQDGVATDRPYVTGPDGVRRSVARNIGLLPGFASLDMRLARTITVGEKVRLYLGFEAFNLLNKKNVILQSSQFYPLDPKGNFVLPDQEDGRYPLTPDRFNGSAPPRQFQLVFKASF